MKAIFIVNPVAGGSDRTEAIYTAVRTVFGGRRGFFRVKRTEDPGHARALAEEALKRGFECVVACGGDATVNEVAGVLVKSPAALGIVPLGRANSLARGLAIPADPVAALGLVRDGKTVAVDAGVFCERFFFGSAGFGLDAGFVKKYRQLFFASKPGEFFKRHPGALRDFLRQRVEEISIRVDNALLKVRSLSLTASNVANYGGPALMAPEADPTDGLIELSIMPALGPLSAPGVARKLLSGRIGSLKGFRRVRGRRIEIPRGHVTDVHVDGEPFEWIGDITISSVQQGLKVLAPSAQRA
jgi:diacylglycerol kinase family enzyme